MPKTALIRPPVESDLAQILRLGPQLHRESWYAHIAYDEACVRKWFGNLLTNSDRSFCRLAQDQNGALLGGVAGARFTYWFSSEAGAFDTFIYTVPEARGTMIAYRLWKSFRDWARDTGAVELTHGVGTGSKSADRFFQGVGMTRVGGIYKLALH